MAKTNKPKVIILNHPLKLLNIFSRLSSSLTFLTSLVFLRVSASTCSSFCSNFGTTFSLDSDFPVLFCSSVLKFRD